MFGTGQHRMSEETLEKMVKDYLALRFEVSSFAFQGGEPTLMGLDFYKKTIELQKKYGADGQVISNALQTNAVLLDDQWCSFLHEYKWLVGISLDGPQKYHDQYRRNHADRGTWQKVMDAIACCKKHKVEFNILVLLNNLNADHPDELFDFFTSLGIDFLQFVPCVENDPYTGQLAHFCVSPEQYGRFMSRIFDRWLEYGPTRLSVRLFDSIMNYILTGHHTNCSFMPRCNDYIVIEHTGQAYCCDFFVQPEWLLGSLHETTIDKLFDNHVKKKFSKNKRDLANKCVTCRHSQICRGGCPKDRITINQCYSDPSYLCEGYRMFFDHALPILKQLTANLSPKK